MAVEPIPQGYHSVTPYLVVEGADTLLSFVKEVFGAEETFRMAGAEGSVGHAEFRVGDSTVMTADASEQWPAMPGAIHLYVEDCDATYARARGRRDIRPGGGRPVLRRSFGWRARSRRQSLVDRHARRGRARRRAREARRAVDGAAVSLSRA